MFLALATFALATDPVTAITRAVAERVGVAISDVEVGPPGLPEGTTIDADWVVDLPNVGSICGSAVTLVLRSTTPAGAHAKYTVRPRIIVWQDIPVATVAATPGQPVLSRLARTSCDRLRGETPVGQGAFQAQTTFRVGDPVTTARVRPMPDKLEGAEVNVIAEEGGVRVRATGTLTEDAYVGKTVHVLNSATKAVVVGRLADDGAVHLGVTR